MDDDRRVRSLQFLPLLCLAAGLFYASLASATATPVAYPDRTGHTVTLHLSAQGNAALNLACPASAQLLHVRVDRGELLSAVALQRLSTRPAAHRGERVPGPFSGGALQLPLPAPGPGELADSRCRMQVQGRPGARLTFSAFVWQPVTLGARLRGMWSDWTGYRSWQQYSINAHAAVVQAWHGLSPNVLLGAVFLLVGLLGFRRWRTRFLLGWMLACWLVLDLPWQWRLLQQAEATRAVFAGVAAERRPGLTEDAALWAFAEQIRTRVPALEPRFFVASASDYAGMRMAYYLYPRNVYWRRDGPELPPGDALHGGDYVVGVQPSELRREPQSGDLVLAGLQARVLLDVGGIALFEVR
jgi:hypothetical protein